jgi:hypothetical protein
MRAVIAHAARDITHAVFTSHVAAPDGPAAIAAPDRMRTATMNAQRLNSRHRPVHAATRGWYMLTLVSARLIRELEVARAAVGWEAPEPV